MTKIEKLKSYWDHKSKLKQKTEKTKYLASSPVLKKYEEEFLNKLDWKNKTILDYGIDQGEFAQYLFNEKEINRYKAIDISPIALSKIRKNLIRFKDQCEFYLYPCLSKSINADIFISLDCIRYFLNRDLLDNFLYNINEGSIQYIILQIQEDVDTYFSQETNITLFPPCHTNNKYISKRLSNYKLLYQGKSFLPHHLQHLIFKRT